MFFHFTCAILIPLISLLSLNSLAADSGEYRKNSILHAECGHLMDKYYYDYGTRVDLIFYNLQTVRKQGVKVPAPVLAANRSTDKELRDAWLNLEERRKKLFKKLYFPKPMEEYALCVKNLEDMPAVHSGWVGFNSFSFEFAEEKKVNVPLKSFIRAAYRQKYTYNCAPSPAIFIYGKQSQRHSAVSNITLPDDIKGDVKFTISGLDCDKGGKPTKIAIYVYGNLIYKGENHFRKNGWTKQKFTIPAKVFKKKSSNAKNKDSLNTELSRLRHDIEDFKKHASQLAETAQKQAAPFLSKLKPNTAKAEFNWRNTYIRSMDISNKLYGVDRFMHPGNYINMEYAAKACADIGVNLTSLEIYRPQSDKEMLEITKDFAQKTSIPFLLWSSNQFFINRDMVSFKYYGNRKKLNADINRFVDTFGKLRNFAGIQVDEPTISDKSSHYGKLLDNAAVREAYRKYIIERKPLLKKNGIVNVTGKPFTGKPKTATEQALWMEWQYFKMNYMADHFSWLFQNIQKRKLMASIVIMNKNKSEPQMCSYPAMGKVLPYLGTDLYGNGDISESFAIQLLKNATRGKAIMWPGAGYSCKSTDTFRRTIATALTHADGIHMWTYVFCSKYRDANYFWRYGGTRENRDDKGRHPRNNWNPQYWYILKNMYKLAATTEKYLIGRKSIAETAILVSERTAIAASAKKRAITYWQNNLNIYSDLAGFGIPMDICFVESLNSDKLNRYKYMIISDATTLATAEVKTITNWVKNGGTLIAAGDLAICDQWGRSLKQSALSEPLDLKSGTMPSTNRYGKGTVYYMPERNIGRRTKRIPNSGLTGAGKADYRKIIKGIISGSYKNLPVEIKGLPDGVELQIQKSGNSYIINLIDWFNKRTIKNVSLAIKAKGKWEIMFPEESDKFISTSSGKTIPLKEFKIYNMIIIRGIK